MQIVSSGGIDLCRGPIPSACARGVSRVRVAVRIAKAAIRKPQFSTLFRHNFQPRIRSHSCRITAGGVLSLNVYKIAIFATRNISKK